MDNYMELNSSDSFLDASTTSYGSPYERKPLDFFNQIISDPESSMDKSTKSIADTYNSFTTGNNIGSEIEELMTTSFGTTKTSSYTSGTNGSYMTSCTAREHNEDNFPPLCFDDCVEGFKPKNYKKCNVAIYEIKDGNISNINNRITETAMLRSYDSVKIPNNAIIKLHKDGVKKISVYTFDKSTRKFERTTEYDVSNLYESCKKDKKVKRNENNNSFAIIVFFLFLFLFIIIVFGLVYWKKNKNKNLSE